VRVSHGHCIAECVTHVGEQTWVAMRRRAVGDQCRRWTCGMCLPTTTDGEVTVRCHQTSSNQFALTDSPAQPLGLGAATLGRRTAANAGVPITGLAWRAVRPSPRASRSECCAHNSAVPCSLARSATSLSASSNRGPRLRRKAENASSAYSPTTMRSGSCSTAERQS
jgi:hypothetical protein